MPAEESTTFQQAENGALSYIVGVSLDDGVITASSSSSPDQSEASELPKLSNRQKNIGKESGDSAYSSTSPSKEKQNSVVDDKKGVNDGGDDDVNALRLAKEDDFGDNDALRRARDKQSPAKVSRINFQEDVQVVVSSADMPVVDADPEKDAYEEEEDKDAVEEAVGGVERPNGGFGWVVMLASFFSHAFGGGILYSFGIFLTEWSAYYDATKSEVSWIGCSMPVMCLIGPFASMLVNKYGARSVGIYGALFGAIGPLLSLWNPTVSSLYFTFGIWIGVGLGITYIPCIVVLSEYFDKNLPIATGIAVSGAGMGTFIFAPIWQILIEEYSWKGSLLFMSGALLNQAVCGALYRPLEGGGAGGGGGGGGGGGEGGKKKSKNGKRNSGKEKLKYGEESEKMAPERQHLVQTIAKLEKENTNKSLNVSIIPHPERAHRTRCNSDRANRSPTSFTSKSPNGLPPVRTCPDGVTLGISGKRNPSSASSNSSYRQHRLRGAESGHNNHSHVQQQQQQHLHQMSQTSLYQQHLHQHLQHPRGGGQPHRLSPSRSQLSLGLLNVPTYSISQHDLNRRSQSSLNSPHLSKVASRKSMQSFASYGDGKEPSIAEIEEEPLPRISSSSSSSLDAAPKTFKERFLKVLDVRLFADPVFVLFSFSMLFVSLGYNIPFVFIVDRAVDLGVGRKDAAFLISIAGITNTIGRIVFGLISNNDRVSRLHVYAISCIICGGFTVVYPLFTSYISMVCYVAAFSLSIAGYLCLTSVLLCDLLGVERLANSLGVCLLVQGVGLLVGPPFAGFLYDWTKSYDSSFIVAGLLLAASGVVLLPIPLLKKCRCSQKKIEIGEETKEQLDIL